MNDEKIIISLGGSLIIPKEIDKEFLKNFKKLILANVKKGRKFVIITGGGKICRKYNQTALQISKLSVNDLDWLGIYTTRLNAQFLRIILGEKYVKKEIIINPTMPIHFTKPIVIGGGWQPGNSSDLCAVLATKTVGGRKIINLSNIDYVYDSDPKVNQNAKKIEKISWSNYRKLIPKEWKPAINTPFDPIASALAEREKMEVIIMNGNPIKNLENYLNGEKFLGTVIL
jgi:uridylate kinase